jgi:hypothetical protein
LLFVQWVVKLPATENALNLDFQIEAPKPLFEFLELTDDILAEAFLESCLPQVVTTPKITLDAFAYHLGVSRC